MSGIPVRHISLGKNASSVSVKLFTSQSFAGQHATSISTKPQMIVEPRQIQPEPQKVAAGSFTSAKPQDFVEAALCSNRISCNTRSKRKLTSPLEPNANSSPCAITDASPPMKVVRPIRRSQSQPGPISSRGNTPPPVAVESFETLRPTSNARPLYPMRASTAPRQGTASARHLKFRRDLQNEELPHSVTAKRHRLISLQNSGCLVEGRRIIEVDMMVSDLKRGRFLSCPTSSCCNRYGRDIVVEVSPGGQRGLYTILVFRCTKCNYEYNVSTCKSSTNFKIADVNLELQNASRICGLGRQGTALFLASLQIPPPVTKGQYVEHEKIYLAAAKKAKISSMQGAIDEIRRLKKLDPTSVMKLTVSYDMSWCHRGFTSNGGIGTVICSETTFPLVIDNEIIIKQCEQEAAARRRGGEHYEQFMRTHECIGTGEWQFSSKSMEPEAFWRMCTRSIEQYNVIYHKAIMDGDAATPARVRDDPPYADCSIERLQDGGHFAQCLERRLLDAKKKLKTEKKDILSDGLPVGRRLTDNTVRILKSYILLHTKESKTVSEFIQRTKCTLFHKCGDHSLCPTGDHSWCMFRQGDLKYVPSNPLSPAMVHEFLLPWCEQHLFQENVLRGVIGGHQTNCNESFHSLMWSITHKEKRMGFHELQAGVSIAIVLYNGGYRDLLNVYRYMGIEPGVETVKAYEERDRLSIYYSDRAVHPLIRQRRKCRKTAKSKRKAKFKRAEKNNPQYSKGCSSGLLPPVEEGEEEL